MTWECYKLRIKAKSPVHIGRRTLGIVALTRYYIPSWVFWAGLTAAKTRSETEKPNPDKYREIGDAVDEHIRFTYFYHAENGTVFCPEWKDGCLKYGGKDPEEFEKEFLDSRVSTSLDRNTGTALEMMESGRGSLHEVEFIKEGTEFEGYCFVTSDYEGKDSLREHLDIALSLQGLGGERNYGFGKFSIVEFKSSAKEIFDLYSIMTDDKSLRLNMCGDKRPVLAHTEYSDGLSFTGDIEPVVRKWWKVKDGERNPVMIAPGGILENVEYFELDKKGLWKPGK